MKVAVIGAGPCGLAAIKCCLEEELDVVCFEQRHDIGGIWDYKEQGQTTDGWPTVMKVTTCNINKELLTFSDFPAPIHFPAYLPHFKYLEYLRLYADLHGLVKNIRFGTKVTHVKQVEEFAETGRWEVTVTESATGNTLTDTFDAVLVCTGHVSKMYRPQFENEQNFKGQIIHSQQYSDNEVFKNKNVVIVGSGNSACDIAVDLANVCSQVYMCIRRGVWMLNRVWDRGEPWELPFFTRLNAFLIRHVLPRFYVNRSIRTILNSHVDHALYGLLPDYDFGQQLPAVNDHLISKLATGLVQVRASIRRLTETGVELTDGSTIDQVEVIICATGYSYEWPFMEHEAFSLKDSREPNLFKLMFPPDICPSTIAMIGLIDTPGTITGSGEMQCRYATRVFKGLIKLPDAKAMQREVDSDKALCRANFLPTSRQFIMRDFITYMDDLAAGIGCQPPGFFRLLLSDPRLAMSVYTNLHTLHQYRLVGPGAWSGARNAVVGINERLRYPLTAGRKSASGLESHSTRRGFIIYTGIFVALASLVGGYSYLSKQLSHF